MAHARAREGRSSGEEGSEGNHIFSELGQLFGKEFDGQGSSAGVHGWQRRFRGQCENGDGVDALDGEGGGSSGGNQTAGARAGAVKESELARSVKRRRGSDTGSGREREKKGKKGAWSLAIMRRGRGLGMYQGKLKEKSWKRYKRNTWVFVLGNIRWSQGNDLDEKRFSRNREKDLATSSRKGESDFRNWDLDLNFDTCTQGFKETSKETKWEFDTFGNGNNYLGRIQGKGLTFGI
uniref:Uncharacterized protein n=1 Tax=Oryza rufipogon TaxID=4529 RepID=A0A0E0QD93_ORYRU